MGKGVAVLGRRMVAVMLVAAATALVLAGGRWSPTREGQGAAREVNVLFLGTDGGSLAGNTDTIVLAHVDPSQRRIAALWIPRDTLVSIPGHRAGKINAANPLGGPELAVATVEDFLGVKVDYYLLADFAAAAAAIDHLGGVDLEVPRDMHYDDPYQDLHIHLRRGRQHLDGEQALAFARFRNSALGDIDRTRYQQLLVEALLRRALSPEGLARLPAAVRALLEGARTNAGLREVASLLAAARGGEWTLVAETLPGSFLTIKGVSYWSVDRERARAAWSDLLQGITHPAVEDRPLPAGAGRGVGVG